MDEVKLKIGADTSGLQQVEKAAKQAFDPRLINETVKAQKEMARSLAESAKSIAEIAKGNKAYNELAKELKTVRSEAEKLKKELAEINRLNGGGPGGRGPGGGGPGGRGPGSPFFAGFAQGSGIANYIPADQPGGLRMAAGSMVGQMVRGGASAAASPFLNPGLGGMATALNSIPVVGGFVAGGLQAAAGMYQERVAWENARLQNIMYMPSVGNYDIAGYMRRATARANAPVKALQKYQNETVDIIMQGGEGNVVRASDGTYVPKGRMGKVTPHGGVIFDPAKGGPITDPNNAEIPQVDIYGDGINGGQVPERLKTRDLANKVVKETANIAIDMTNAMIVSADEKANKEIAAARARLVSGPGIGSGVRLGYGAGETQQHYGAFMGAYGGRAVAGTGAQFNQAQDLLRGFGIDMSISGGLARAGAAGGGALQGENSNAISVLAAGVAQGLQGSRLVEHMQRMVSLTAKAEQEGMKISLRGVSGSALAIAAAGGNRGDALRASADAARFAQKQQDVGLAGVSDPLDLVLMQAGGYNNTQESYFKTKRKFRESGMNEEDTLNLLGMLVKGTANEPGYVAQDQIMNAARRVGINLTDEQVESMRTSGFTAEGAPTEQTRTMIAEMRGKERLISGKNIRQYAEGMSSLIGANVKTEKAMEAERVGEGGKWGKVMQSAQTAMIGQVKVMGNFSDALTNLAKTVTATTGWLDRTIKRLQGKDDGEGKDKK